MVNSQWNWVWNVSGILFTKARVKVTERRSTHVGKAIEKNK